MSDIIRITDKPLVRRGDSPLVETHAQNNAERESSKVVLGMLSCTARKMLDEPR